MGDDRCGASHLKGRDGPLEEEKDASAQTEVLDTRVAWELESET